MNEYAVVNNRDAHRFEVDIEGEVAVVEYAENADTVDLLHTEVPPSLEGRGIGGALAKAGLEYAKQAGKRVVPTCPFVRTYIKRHPDWNSIVAAGA
jgi:predicted GNAT family acetyltransferase